MFLLPHHLQEFLKEIKGEKKRIFADDVDSVEISDVERQIEIYPEDPLARKQWFSLSLREREVAALVCMGYRKYEIASIMAVGYETIKTHLKNILYKFDASNIQELRLALKSWQAEEWWKAHH